MATKGAAPSIDDELDRLYAGPPGDFVAGRDELAGRRKGEGDRDGAARLKKLRRPSQAAALVNWLSAERGKDLRELAETLASMREPSTAADGRKLRAAVKRERDLVAKLLAAAEEEAGRRGVSGPATVDRVGETLRAIATDPDLERAVLAGRLEKEGEASTLGFELSAPSSKARARVEAKPGPDPKVERAALKRLAKEAATADRAVDAAAAGVERAEEQLKTAREMLRDAKAEAKRARAEVRRQERRASSL